MSSRRVRLPTFEEAMRLADFLEREAATRSSSACALRAMESTGAPVADGAAETLERRDRALRYAAALIVWLGERADRLDELDGPPPMRRARLA